MLLAHSLAFLLHAQAFASRTLVVDPKDGDFPTVAQASAEARPGDTVLLRAHDEALDAASFKSGVRYVGSHARMVPLTLSGVEDVVLEGFWLSQLTLTDVKNVTVSKSRVARGNIRIAGSRDVRITDSALATAAKQATVLIERSMGVVLSDDLIEGSNKGVVASESDVLIERCTIVNTRYKGTPLDANSLADAHESVVQGAAVLVECGKSPSRLGMVGSIVALNEKGLVVDVCATRPKLDLRDNVWFENAGGDYIVADKKYQRDSFSYVLEAALTPSAASRAGNKRLDPLFTDAAIGDYSLKAESPAARMGAKAGGIGASREATRVSAVFLSSLGSVEAVSKLVERGADVNAGDADGFTPLMAAAVSGQADMADYLLKHGASVDAKDKSGATALHGAALAGHPGIVEALLARGADPNMKDAAASTPLHAAAYSGDLRSIKALLARKADANALDDTGFAPLGNAALKGHLKAMDLLLRSGAKAQLKGAGGRLAGMPPLFAAAMKGRLDAARLLLMNGADANALTEQGIPVLGPVAMSGNAELVALLLKHGAKAETRSDSGKTPLAAAVERGHLDVVRQLLAHGANPDTADPKWGITPLMRAAQRGSGEIVDALLKKGASVMATDKTGKTALIAAVLGASPAVAKKLLAAGARAGHQDSDGKSALDYACAPRQEALVALLGGRCPK